MLVALGCVSGLLALSLVQFFRLTSDAPVARLEVRQQGDGQFQVRASAPGIGEKYVLYGDQWQIDARVVRWKLPALMAGVPPLYRLERLSGRYGDAAREAAATRSVHSLDDWPAPDLGSLKKSFPNWFPFVDVQFGGAYMPFVRRGPLPGLPGSPARCSPARTDRPRRKGSSAWAGEAELAPVATGGRTSSRRSPAK